MTASPVPSYSATLTQIDGVEIARLTGPNHVAVSIAPKLGNNAFEFLVNGKNAFWFPYDSVGDFAADQNLCGNPFLAPWANRLDEHAFYANGVRYELNRGLGNYLLDPENQPIHGLLLYATAWDVIGVRSGPDWAQVTSRLDFGRFPMLMAQFPFAHSIAMTYTLSGTSLEVRTVITNQAAETMPLSVGFHPYFQLHDSPRDDWRVHLAADSLWDLNDRFTPTGTKSPVTRTFPRAAELPLRGEFLDHVFGDLQFDSGGCARFRVQGAREQLTVSYLEGFPVAVVYAPTGAGQDFICFEPMSGITNAFNLSQHGLYGDLSQIPPHSSWTGRYEISVEGF